MTAHLPRVAATAAALALLLSGCTTSTPAGKGDRPARPAAESGIPLTVLDVGDSFAADLRGNGRATITVAASEVADQAAGPGHGAVRLVVTVKILLDKAGNPIAGGPENFRFRDRLKEIHRAKTDAQAFPPELPPINLTTTGQQAYGKVYFEVAPDLVEGGYIQLMTGQLVHALWRV